MSSKSYCASRQLGARFGLTFKFDGRALSQLGKDDKVKFRKGNTNKAKALGIDAEKWLADDRYQVDKWNILQWMNFEEYIDKHSKKYWTEKRPNDITEKPESAFEKNKGNIQLILRENPDIGMRNLPIVPAQSTDSTKSILPDCSSPLADCIKASRLPKIYRKNPPFFRKDRCGLTRSYERKSPKQL